MGSEFLWRKQVLPLGRFPWRNRELDFTPAYLSNIAEAFAGGALDVVPFTAEDRHWGPVNDPERCHGTVCGVEAVSDGMDALVTVDAETDAQLEADPGLPATVRLVENYRTTAGREFPVVLAMVYTTRSPAPFIAGLRPWKRED